MARRWRRRLLFGSALFGVLLISPASFHDAVFAQVPEDCESPPPLEPVIFSKTDSPEPVPAGSNLTYALTLDPPLIPPGPFSVTIGDPLPAQTTFQSLSAPGGWTCTTPAVGSPGTVTCTNAAFTPTGVPQVFTLVVAVGLAAPPTLSNTATLTETTLPFVCTASESTAVTGGVPALSDLARWTLVVLLLAAGVLVVRRNRRPASRPPPPAAV